MDLFLKPLNKARSSHKRNKLSITRFHTAAHPGMGEAKITLSTSLNLQKTFCRESGLKTTHLHTLVGIWRSLDPVLSNPTH